MTTAATGALTVSPGLLAELEAMANKEQRTPAEVLEDAVKRYAREQRREEILARVDAAEASLARGEGILITEASMHQLADAVKQRGRARLAAENIVHS